jgi:TatD DNase family protein
MNGVASPACLRDGDLSRRLLDRSPATLTCMFDTHCHLTFPEFAGRTAAILESAAAEGVRGAITISTTTADCLQTRDLALAHANLWHSAGVHPLYSDQPREWSDMLAAASSPKCVAWGELGLDNHYAHPPRALQRAVLEEQLAVIKDWESQHARKPIVLHCREAFDDLIAVLRSTALDPARMVFHCFTGTVDDARKALDFGAWISFTGIVTFANAKEVAAAAKLAPADRMMVETDAPFLTPEPVRKVRPNEPKYVVHVGRRLAELRGVNPGDFEEVLDANAKRFFGIGMPPKGSR